MGVAVTLLALSIASEVSAVAAGHIAILHEIGMAGNVRAAYIEEMAVHLQNLWPLRAIPIAAGATWAIGSVVLLPAQLRSNRFILVSLAVVGISRAVLALAGDLLPLVLQGLTPP